MLVITQLPCCIFIKYLQCYFSFILKYAIFFWGLKYFTVLSLKLLISSPELLFFGAGSLFFEGGYIFCMMEPQGGGGVLWYFHTYVGSGYFFGFKILNFNIFGVFRMNIFLDMKILRIFFGGSSQNWASFRVISMHFRVFFKVKGTELGYFLGLLKF